MNHGFSSFLLLRSYCTSLLGSHITLVAVKLHCAHLLGLGARQGTDGAHICCIWWVMKRWPWIIHVVPHAFFPGTTPIPLPSPVNLSSQLCSIMPFLHDASALELANGLNSFKTWALLKFSSFKLWRSGIVSQQ